jgi:DNA-binding XRE family transcriptional regulator
MKNEGKKALARELFIKSALTRKEIATNVGVTEKTLRSWIDAGNWETIKESIHVTRNQLLDEAYQQLAAINKKIREEYGNAPTKELSDVKSVIRKEIETFSSQPLHKYIEVFEEMIQYLQKNHPAQVSIFGNLSQEFITEVSKRK